jgi:SAM-dependent methyltransferase
MNDNSEIDPLLGKISGLRPQRLLDIGCGCGCFGSDLVPLCNQLVSIDISVELLRRARNENLPQQIDLLQMDGRALGFADKSFDAVCERFTLHHIKNWDIAIDEMLRVAKNSVLIEEPIDDTRSEPKRNAILAWQLYLDLHKEIGYSHFRHIRPDELTAYFKSRSLTVQMKIEKTDDLRTVDDFFADFDRFANKSKRPDYWLGRLADFKKEFADKSLCHSDVIFIEVCK